MAYFLPSFFQKRVLRYALSRLQLVDTDALDLDSLGITWGQRSSFELKDLALRFEKLASLLKLPPTCDLTRARVSLLRVTIPADIYSSGIIIEAEGIEVHLRLLPDESPEVREHAPDSPSGGSAGDHSQGILPSTTDLAQSFLESEPPQETEELQAALSSQSHYQSDAFSNNSSSDEDDEEVGLHDGVSLPGFVAGFFKSVLDRLQLKIVDVTLRIDMEVRQGNVSSSSSSSKPVTLAERLDPITGVLNIENISIDGVSVETIEEMRLKAGKRLTSLSGIHFSLVSDPSIFENYSRFNQPAAPPSSVSHSRTSHSLAREDSSPPQPASASSSFHTMTHSTVFEPPASRQEDSLPPHLDASINSQDGRFSDAATDDGYGSEHGTYLSSSMVRSHDDILQDSRYLHDPMRYANDIEDSTGNLYTSYAGLAEGTARSQAEEHSSSVRGYSPRQPHHHFGTEEPGTSVGSLQGKILQDKDQETRQYEVDAEQSPENLSPYSTNPSSQEPTEDLSMSRIYTHEEAQSMYMSAMSHAPSDTSRVYRMPGTLSSSSESESHLTTGEASQPRPRLVEDPAAPSTPRASGVLPLESDREAHRGDQFSEHGGQPHPDSVVIESLESPLQLSGLRKTVLDIERITIWIPSFDSKPIEGEECPPEAHRKVPPNLKESTFTMHESTIHESRHGSLASSPPLDRQGPSGPRRSDENPGKLTDDELTRALEFDITSANIKFDIACGWLFVLMGQGLATAWSQPTPDKQQQVSQNSGSTSFPLSLALSSFRVQFMQHIAGQIYGYSNIMSTNPELDANGDVILHLALSDVALNSATSGNTLKYHLQISKFLFGYASEDIISFDDSLRLRESTRDALAPLHGDISISITRSALLSQLHVSTLPLHLVLNIRRLDETLSWFGGLSTVLELGSSVASGSTARGGKQTSKTVLTKPRGVHFEQPIPNREEENAKQAVTLPWKINTRVAGLTAHLIGRRCSLKLDSSAVKVVSRFAGVGIQIDKARLSGPHHALTDPNITPHVDLLNIRIEFLFEPKEVDLDRLLTLLTPSKDKYDEDDDIMIDTLFRQRRQGSVLRITVSNLVTFVPHPELLLDLSSLGDEFAKLSTVAKYIPQDDRPGIMILALIRDFEGQVNIGQDVGIITITSQGMEGCFVSFPSLIAARLSTITVIRNGSEELLGEAIPQESPAATTQAPLPMVMARYIPDEMDPTVKIKLFNVRVEYAVPSVSAFLGLSGEMTAEDIAANMAHSVVNLAELKTHPISSDTSDRTSVISSEPSAPPKLSVNLRDCLIGLNPRGSPSKGLVVLADARFHGALNDDKPSEATFEIHKASLVIIDNAASAGTTDNFRSRRKSIGSQGGQIQKLEELGYVSVATISSARAAVKVMQLEAEGQKSLDIELKNNLLIIETCADSTQTLLTVLNGLALPSPPNKTMKYRTEVVPIADMLSSFTGDAFELDQMGGFAGVPVSGEVGGGLSPIDEDASTDELEYVSDFYPPPTCGGSKRDETAEGGFEPLLDSFHSEAQISSSVGGLDFQDDHFAKQSAVGGTAHRWDSTHNTYSLTNEVKLRGSPLRVRVRDVHVIWNLFDGYDWHRTRDTISKAVKDVQAKATERRARASPADEEDEESVIGDFLFNSVYIGIPTNRDPRELAHEINRNIDDLASETGSYATSTTVTGLPSHPPGTKREKLRLARSKHHKMTFELSGIAADMVIFPPGSGETQSSLDVRVYDLEIFDHLPTSTWKKFATYMHDAGEREVGTSMVHLEVLNVKPVAELAASEFIIKATILPLRLHVDQDALDFMSRFFEFRDESAISVNPTPGDIPFLQRVEVNSVQVRLDFKPKRVDYAGLRSGRTTEFMNFFVLDEADMVLRHVIIYGVSGFDRLGMTLNDIWMPDVKANQLPSILAGLAPVKSLVNIGSGVKDLVVIPMREYQKDGRVVRSIQKGAVAFARTTTSELVKLGAKLAIGTQTVLQSAEDFLNNPGGIPPQPVASAQEGRLEDTSIDEDERKQISLYADQPLGVVQGLRGAYASLERDLLLARDAIIAVSGEVMESSSATGAAKALWKRAPTVVLRPAIGASKAVGQTLLGAGNTLDPKNRRRMDDKYKRH